MSSVLVSHTLITIIKQGQEKFLEGDGYVYGIDFDHVFMDIQLSPNSLNCIHQIHTAFTSIKQFKNKQSTSYLTSKSRSFSLSEGNLSLFCYLLQTIVSSHLYLENFRSGISSCCLLSLNRPAPCPHAIVERQVGLLSVSEARRIAELSIKREWVHVSSIHIPGSSQPYVKLAFPSPFSNHIFCTVP